MGRYTASEVRAYAKRHFPNAFRFLPEPDCIAKQFLDIGAIIDNRRGPTKNYKIEKKLYVGSLGEGDLACTKVHALVKPESRVRYYEDPRHDNYLSRPRIMDINFTYPIWEIIENEEDEEDQDDEDDEVLVEKDTKPEAQVSQVRVVAPPPFPQKAKGSESDTTDIDGGFIGSAFGVLADSRVHYCGCLWSTYWATCVSS
ncbi:hypothetical protein K491DRAFT_711172 [Lophiostoma macrostomum CBS 122681]|uniref:Uncharacterized protein n=1 Tax=Lophiostoma macrostomum CBS 122681 TaxID=1314788 RepID=A0A6A6TNZ3_9PLEO|nr:hypothetical protein K491DRAFT_711172 [Lophiostoma macrostomum CBS 122681]